MAEPLKNNYKIDVAINIAATLEHVSPQFDSQGFIAHVEDGYQALELMDRARKIAEALKDFLPDNYQAAVDLLLTSLEAPLELDPKNSIAAFIFMPHTMFIANNGGDDFETSMHALYVLTQRFTSEFAIRPFIQRYPEKTMMLLQKWAKDPNHHVRRLVSEGTRTRLPWASRLPEFIKDPSPVLALLEFLKDDPELYVRRSVANNLNDLGKDHPDLLAKLAKRWLQGAPPEREWLVKHSLRSAIKRGEQGALDALGYGKPVKVVLQNIMLTPKNAKIGDSVQVCFDLLNLETSCAALMVDFCIYFMKANGEPSPKVFKLKTLKLAAGNTHCFKKKVSLKPMTTHTLYAGKHKVDVIVNGKNIPLGEFTLTD